MKLALGLKVISTLITASVGMLLNDPKLFMSRVAERARQASEPVSRSSNVRGSYFRLVPRVTSSLFNLPNSFLVSNPVKSDWRNKASLISKRRNTLEELFQELPATRATNSGLETDSPLRVGFVLTNSLPYTESGYTYRSQKTLQHLGARLEHLVSITRLGYPVIVGKLPLRNPDIIEGVSYYRSMSYLYPRNRLKRLKTARKILKRWAEEHELTIIHTTTDFNNALVVSWVARELGIPWVYEVRGELENTWLSRFPNTQREAVKKSAAYRELREIETRCMKRANRIVALSEVSKRSMVSRGVQSSKIHVVRNAVDSEIFSCEFEKEQVRRELGLTNCPKIGSVSSLVGYEGFEYLLRAAVEIPGVEVILVGDGADVPRLKSIAVELDIQDRVIFAGRQRNSDIWKWYAALDVFVVPRIDAEVCRRVTPIKPLMAQALGVPVVASDLPALREVTGNHAHYVKPETVSELAAAIRIQLTSSQDQQDSRAWAQENTWERNVEKYLSMYEALRVHGFPNRN